MSGGGNYLISGRKRLTDLVGPDGEPSLCFVYLQFCPYSTRIRLLFKIKGTPWHKCLYSEPLPRVSHFLQNNDSLFPCLMYERKVISQSLVLADFLDEVYPQPPLWNCSPLQKILDKIVIQSFEKVEKAVYKLFIDTPAIEMDDFLELIASLIPFEAELVKRGSKFFGGANPNMVDYMIWPWFEYFDALKPYTEGKFVIPFDEKFPRLAEWKALMIVDKAVASYYSPELLAKQILPIKNELFAKNFFMSMPSYGNNPNMVDYMIWTWFELLDAINPYSKGTFIFPFDDKFPRLAEWKALMFVDEAVAVLYSPDYLAK